MSRLTMNVDRRPYRQIEPQGINAFDRAERRAAVEGSRALLKAMFAYYRRRASEGRS